MAALVVTLESAPVNRSTTPLSFFQTGQILKEDIFILFLCLLWEMFVLSELAGHQRRRREDAPLSFHVFLLWTTGL